MGRNRRYRYVDTSGSKAYEVELRSDSRRAASIKTSHQLSMFSDDHNGPIQRYLWDGNLITFDERGETVVNKSGIMDAIEQLRGDRDYIREQGKVQMEREIKNMPYKDVTTFNRIKRAEAEAIALAARVVGQKLTPAQKQLLDMAKRDFFSNALKDHEKGDYYERRANRKWRPGKSSDPAARARAREKAEQLHGYRDMKYTDRPTADFSRIQF
jgi:DNA-directed RNA polymerase